MNWLVLIVSFAIAVLVGSFLGSMLQRNRPHWSARRRLWTAAMALPGFIVLLTLCGVGLTMVITPAPGEGYRGLYSAVYALMGAIFFVIALIGGLFGAAAAARKDQL